MLRITLLAAVAYHVLAILTPVVANQPRCFMLHSYTIAETLKLDIKLPSFKRRFTREGFVITILDTNTSKLQEFQPTESVWRYELAPTAGILYKVCYTLRTDQPVDDLVVDFQTAVAFSAPKHSYSNLSHYAKRESVASSHDEAFFLAQVADKVREAQDQRQKEEQTFFFNCSEIMAKVSWISVLELLLMVALAVLQTLVIVKFVQSR